MLRIRLTVLVEVTGRAADRKEDRIIERLVRRTARGRKHKREVSALGTAIGAGLEGCLHQGWLDAHPILSVGSVGHLVKHGQVLDGRVVNSVGRADAGLSRAAKQPAQYAFGG